jgi:hyaluronan synthase
VTQVTVLQILLTPFSMGTALVYLAASVVTAQWTSVVLALGWLLGGRAIRGISHLRDRPRDIVYLPLIVIMTVITALLIKTYGFATMNEQGWLTRSSDRIGGEAQTEASLHVDDRIQRASVPGG